MVPSLRPSPQALKEEVVYGMEFKFYADDYANIIIFQKGKGSMNYYTLLPNYYQGFNTPRAMSCPQPQQNILPVLKVLSQALKLSISQFSAFYKPNAPGIEPKISTPEGKGQFQSQQIIENLKSEEKNQKTSHFKKDQIEIIEQNAVNLQVCGQKHNQNSSQTHSNDEVLSENIVATPLKENDDFSPHHRKENIRPKKHSFQVVVPEVDLLETITPPALQMGEESLRKIREGLMLRKVQLWNEKMKNRKDKREIRMLNK